MTCIKTGADVVLLPYHDLVHGDLFEVGDCYALHRCKESLTPQPGDKYNTSFNFLAAGYNNVVEVGDFIIIPKLFCSDFNYEGWIYK